MATNPPTAPTAREALARFEALLVRSERMRARRLTLDELRELAALYRQHSARLARLRDRNADPDAIRHLNALCVRAYGFLYASESPEASPAAGPGAGPAGDRRRERDPWGALGRAFASTGGLQLLAWALLLAGIWIGGVLTVRDPDALYAFVAGSHGYGAEQVDRLWASPAARAEFLERNETPAGRNALFGSLLFSNNTRVGILAFATGMLAGIPTVLLLVYNGMLLGAFGAIFVRGPHALEFAAWILPHGVPELTAVVLCSTAGLVLGRAVAAPGRRPRRAALRDATGPALVLVGASVPLFLAAALVESFVRESALGTSARLAVAAFFAALLMAFGAWMTHLSRRRPVDTDWLQELQRSSP